MEIPEILGYEVKAEIGRGSAGVVYEAVSEDGGRWAIKVFDSMTSNAALLARQVRRVIDGGAEGATVQVLAQALEARPALVVMPLLDGSRSLQMAGGGEFGWDFLMKLAGALEKLHRAKVAHGNLKPGNVFLSDSGEPLLGDYASGLMPGVHHHQYSDAVLYAPPEQLRNPDGYLEEAGYRWDVYAFGVLGYRLMYGSFPRANDLFSSVCAAFGTNERFEIEADHEGVAAALELGGEVKWPEGEVDEVELRRRAVLVSCLSLEPSERPFDLGEVVRLFGVIDGELAVEKERAELISAREAAERKRKSSNRRFAMVSMLALGLGAGWGVTQFLRDQEAGEADAEFSGYREGAEGEILGLEAKVSEIGDEKMKVMEGRDQALASLAAEKGKSLEELRSAQVVNERLFDWLLEEGVEEMPTLEGRKERLGFLLEKIDEQLAGMAERPALAGQAAVLRLRGAELALAAGDLKDGEKRLEEALTASGLSSKAKAKALLRLVLLASKRDAGSLDERLTGSEESIRQGWSGDEVGMLRVDAALGLAKARIWEAQGDGKKALAEYLVSLEAFKKLEEGYPENPALTLRVGRGYLSAALAAEGEGVVENTAKLREEAAKAFVALAKKEKKPSAEVLYQIASARAGQAVAMWQQGDIFGAEKIAREGMAKLSALQAKMPGDFRVTVDLVSQQGIVATALRDEGKATEARGILRKGIEQLESGLESDPKNGTARYLLASMKWQLSGVLGVLGEGAEELKMGRNARDGLKSLLDEKLKRPHPMKVRKSLAYLCGDLGHGADLHEKKEDAVAYFKECRNYWEELVKADGEELEFREGHRWAVDRLADLGVK